jgi:protein phosphatase
MSDVGTSSPHRLPGARLAARGVQRTDVGAVRERNEDACYVDPDGRFAILADGMGGHGAGDVASAMAVDVVRTCLAAIPGVRPREARTLLERAVRLANDAVLTRSRHESDKAGMGTTLDVVLVIGGEAFVAHVGDSRVYLVSDGAAQRLTADHTVAEVMRQAGQLTEEEARVSPARSVLCNAIGVSEATRVDHAHARLRRGDRILLCSDGLYEYLPDDEVATRVAAGTADDALAAMVAHARQAGGHDNITGVVLEVIDAPRPLDEIEDAPTNPIAVAAEPPPAGPLATLSEDSMVGVIEEVLRESSAPVGR